MRPREMRDETKKVKSSPPCVPSFQGGKEMGCRFCLIPYPSSLISVIFFVSLLSFRLHAVPPPPGFVVPTEKTCKLNPTAFKERAAALKAAPFFPTPLSATTAYVLVIRVDFSDAVMANTKTETEQFMANMKNFYLENSYGLLTVNATVTNNIYRMPLALSSYAQGICSVYSTLAHDSVGKAGTDYNFATGAPGGGRFHHIMVYHAGIGAETANDGACQTDNLWSVFAPTVAANAALTDGVTVPFTLNGIEFNGVTVVPESEGQSIDPLGVICHEYGHQLGLPDLYKTASQSVVGKWSLMDSGIYIGAPLGSNPAHMDAWCKQFLGFIAPQSVTPGDTASSLTMPYSATSRTAFVRVPISGVAGVDGSKEYFLVERRARTSQTGKTYDDSLPFGSLLEGYLVWHIDDNIASNESRLQGNNINAGTPNYGVDLVEADGGGSVATTLGKDSDPFPGSKGKTLFATPLSNSFSGMETGIALAGFSGGILVAKKALASSSVELAKTVNYPNPGGPGYAQKAGAGANTLTTIVVNATRPPQKLELTIHDLYGSLVRDVPEALISANGNATTNSKFVFEYEWDGKNDAGETVAPGVYLYRFRADDKIAKTGKLVLVR